MKSELTKNKRIMLVIFCLLLPLFLLLLSYKLVLFFTDLTPAQENVFGFLKGGEELTPGFAKLEISHLEDVKKVMKSVDDVFFALLLAVTVIITFHRKDRDFLLKLLKLGGITTLLTMLFVVMLSVLFFDFIFAIFHNVFFPQGNWLFAPDSVIIQAFPLDFFITISRNIFLAALFFGTYLVVLEID